MTKVKGLNLRKLMIVNTKIVSTKTPVFTDYESLVEWDKNENMYHLFTPLLHHFFIFAASILYNDFDNDQNDSSGPRRYRYSICKDQSNNYGTNMWKGTNITAI